MSIFLKHFFNFVSRKHMNTTGYAARCMRAKRYYGIALTVFVKSDAVLLRGGYRIRSTKTGKSRTQPLYKRLLPRPDLQKGLIIGIGKKRILLVFGKPPIRQGKHTHRGNARKIFGVESYTRSTVEQDLIPHRIRLGSRVLPQRPCLCLGGFPTAKVLGVCHRAKDRRVCMRNIKIHVVPLKVRSAACIVGEFSLKPRIAKQKESTQACVRRAIIPNAPMAFTPRSANTRLQNAKHRCFVGKQR